MQEEVKREQITCLKIDPNEKIIYTYIGIDDNVDCAYYIYDPSTDKHHKVSKEKYEEIMKNARSLERHDNS